MNPKISIITITFNSEKTLEETIQSVISQNYDNLEYLIIDGGSTDRTLEIVEKYKDKIDIVISEPDKGISDAFNKGIRNASGEIIGIINSDDLLLPNALRNVASAFETNIDVYRGNTIVWNQINDTRLQSLPRMEFHANSLSMGGVCHQSTFIHISAYKRYGVFREKLKFMMDVDLLTRLYEKGAKFKYVNADLAISRSGGITDKYSFWLKKNEVYDIVITNGGFKFIAFIKTAKFITYQSLKKFLVNIIGISRR